MENIFDKLTAKLPKATPEELEMLDEDMTVAPFEKFKGKSMKNLVLDWQQDRSPEKTEFMLKKLRPTINSARTSFAPGMEKSLQIKATKLALDAAASYDPSYGTDPSTHVFHTLKRLYRYGAKRNNILPISERGYAEAKYIKELAAEFEDAKGREPSAMELADRSGFSVKKINKILSENAAKLFNLYPKKGALMVGSDADITVYDPSVQWTISAANQHQNVDHTPYEGFEVQGQMKYVFVNGQLAVVDGEPTGVQAGTFVRADCF